MKIKKIAVGLGLTISVGDHEFIKPSVYLDADLEEGEDYQEAMDELYESAEAELEATGMKLAKHLTSLRAPRRP